MTNLLNSIVANQSLNRPSKQVRSSSFTIDTTGKVKPLEDKAILLPSRIFGSPVEYVKDLKKDVVAIGKAAKGKANDHELGRINDLAMKIGSLGLASYLFVKNPMKLSKAMEFVGFGTFFGAMALWPKLAIQAPLKLRTGVDIHQKYIDSQGRKKMLHQDPQYDLTDLYTRDDLDRMGKKLGVSEVLPDRDNFIKQRAKKTAVQGNTLWMLTAGFATPLISALSCNLAEPLVTKAMEWYDLKTTGFAMKKLSDAPVKQGLVGKIKQAFADNSFNSFLAKNAESVLDEKMIEKIAKRMGKESGSTIIQDAIREELKAMTSGVKLDADIVKNALSTQKFNGKGIAEIIAGFGDEAKAAFEEACKRGSVSDISSVLSENIGTNERSIRKIGNTIQTILKKEQSTVKKLKLADATDRIKQLKDVLHPMNLRKGVIDKFVAARVGDKGNTFVSNQWGRITNDFIKNLGLSQDDLLKLADGNYELLTQTLEKLTSDKKNLSKTTSKLMESMGIYDDITGSGFIHTVKKQTAKMSSLVSDLLRQKGFTKAADVLRAGNERGTLETIMNSNAANRATGARDSFFRLLQSLEIFQKAGSGELKQKLTKAFTKNGVAPSEQYIDDLIAKTKQIILTATPTEYAEKLKNCGFEIDADEYKKVFSILFEATDDAANKLGSTAKNKAQVFKAFNKYKAEFVDKVLNWKNSITPELERCAVSGVTESMNGSARSQKVAKTVTDFVQEGARKAYNTNKWMKIFRTSFVALVGVTLAAGLLIGRKTKIEKQIEEERKGNVNG